MFCKIKLTALSRYIDLVAMHYRSDDNPKIEIMFKKIQSSLKSNLAAFLDILLDCSTLLAKKYRKESFHAKFLKHMIKFYSENNSAKSPETVLKMCLVSNFWLEMFPTNKLEKRLIVVANF